MSIFIPGAKKVKNIFASVLLPKVNEFALYGKATQDGEPTPENQQPIEVSGESGSVAVKSCGKNLLENKATSQTINGVTFTVNEEDKSVTVNGKPTATTFFYLVGDSKNESGFKLGGKYIASSKNYISSSCYMRVGVSGGNHYYDITREKEMEFDENSDIYVVIRLGKDAEINNVTLYPMIRLATDTDNTYEPYKGTTATIPTPNGLAGIKVSSNGNYTDQNGQQWICDEVVKYADGSGEKNQRVGKKRITSNMSFNVWTTQNGTYNRYMLITNDMKRDNSGSLMCTHLQKIIMGYAYSEKSILGVFIDASSNSNNTYIGFINPDWKTIDDFKAFLDANEVYVLYELATPIHTPLTAEEIAEIDKLATFDEVTVSNDADCDMSISFGKYYETKKIVSAWANKDGLPAKIYSDEMKPRFVCVGASGESYYSLDGETWVAMSGLDSTSYNGVTYGNGRYVCVGNDGSSYYSTNGTSWVAMSGLDSTIKYNGVAYGNGRFVCVGASGKSCYSLDGKTWTATDLLPNATFNDITYGNDRFVAVGASGRAYYSFDGENWTQMSGAGTRGIYGVAYGNGRFVYVGDYGESYYSLDGENWVAMSGLMTGSSYTYYEVCYGNDRFVCVGMDGWTHYSTDGVKWTRMIGAPSAIYKGVTYGNDRFVAVGHSGKSCYSLDGENWIAMSNDLGTTSYFGVCYSIDGGYDNS